MTTASCPIGYFMTSLGSTTNYKNLVLLSGLLLLYLWIEHAHCQYSITFEEYSMQVPPFVGSHVKATRFLFLDRNIACTSGIHLLLDQHKQLKGSFVPQWGRNSRVLLLLAVLFFRCQHFLKFVVHGSFIQASHNGVCGFLCAKDGCVIFRGLGFANPKLATGACNSQNTKSQRFGPSSLGLDLKGHKPNAF